MNKDQLCHKEYILFYNLVLHRFAKSLDYYYYFNFFTGVNNFFNFLKILICKIY